MAFTLSEAARRACDRSMARGAVRPGSVEAGSIEDRFFAVPGRGETDRLLRMARAALDAGRRLRRDARAQGRALTPAEAPVAALTAGAVRVFEEICTLARLNAGRVFPTYDHLARATALGRATVARALRLLEAAGFLRRQRRFRRSAHGHRQTSNLYRALLPAALLRFLPRRFHAAPPPDDAVQARLADARAVTAMRATLDCRELAGTLVGGELGRMLARLGAAVDRAGPESHSGTRTLSESILYGDAGGNR